MNKGRRIIDPILTNVAKANKQGNMVGLQLFPRVTVNSYGGQIIEYDDTDFIPVDSSRAAGGCIAGIQVGRYNGNNFALTMHALMGEVPIEHVSDAQNVPGINLQMQAVNTVQAKLNLELEIEHATKARDANNYGSGNKTTLTDTNRWDDTGVDPKGTVMTAKEAIRTAIGVYPNTMIVPALTNSRLKVNDVIVERFQYNNSPVITDAMLQQYFEMENYLVPMAVSLPQLGGTKVDVWGVDVILAYVAPPQGSNSKEMAEPSFGYTYVFEGHPLVEPGMYERKCKKWEYPVSYDRTVVMNCPDAGYLIKDATTP